MAYSRAWHRVLATCALSLSMCGDSAGVDVIGDGDAAVVCSNTCDDGVYCNGVETCDPSDPDADSMGCVAGPAPCDGSCDEDADECETGPGCVDADGDGAEDAACGGTDCDDADPDRYPGNMEICDPDDRDEDCDLTTLGDDADGDGFVDVDCCNAAEGMLACGNDCDDTSAAISPSGSDGCGGGDEDCDGSVDEEPDSTFYRDQDDDTYGDDDDTLMACALPSGYAARGGDCADDPFEVVRSNEINPGATEICDEQDNDCDGTIDEQPDGDAECACTTPGMERACGLTDPTQAGVGICVLGVQTCNDGTWSTCVDAVAPRDEECDADRRDEDCDGEPNEGCDCDGFEPELCDHLMGDCALGMRRCNGEGMWGNCSVPVQAESCGGGDEDCDGTIDETGASGTLTFYRDADNDTYGDAADTVQACAAPAGYVGRAQDCNDSAASANPNGTEECEGEIDEDCDGTVDEMCECENGEEIPCGVTDVGDCRLGTQTCVDGSWLGCIGNIDPDTEVCGGGDEDCDGTANESSAQDANTYYRDADGDGYGNPSRTRRACSRPSGYVSNNGDCNDSNSNIRPGVNEIAGDEVDQNCDNLEECWQDADGDTYRTTEKVDSDDLDCRDSGEATTSRPLEWTGAGQHPCCDMDPNMHQGQSNSWFSLNDGLTGNASCPSGRRWDYDCDGDEELRYERAVFSCFWEPAGCSRGGDLDTSGWFMSGENYPDCGTPALPWGYSCHSTGPTSCAYYITSRSQDCR